MGLGSRLAPTTRSRERGGDVEMADFLCIPNDVAPEQPAFHRAEAEQQSHLRGFRRKVAHGLAEVAGRSREACGDEREHFGEFLQRGAHQFLERGDGVTRKNNRLHDHAHHHAKPDLLDAQQRIVRGHRGVRLAVRRDHDVGHPGEEKRIRRAGLAEHGNGKCHHDKSERQVKHRRLLERPGRQKSQRAADNRPDQAQHGFFLHRADIVRHAEHEHGENRPGWVFEPNDEGQKENDHHGDGHLQAKHRAVEIHGCDESGQRALARGRFHAPEARGGTGLRPRQRHGRT